MKKIKSKNTPDPWEGLNERQQLYLRAIYNVDQEVEKEEKAMAAMDRRSRPAEEWRWLKYAYDPFGNKTPLLEQIHNLNLVDPGTGSTFKALASRNLILLRYHKTPFGEDIPEIRMTPKGRKLVRAATGEARHSKQPPGTLREWHWRALVMLYCADLKGEEGVFQDSYDTFGGISWSTWLRLKGFKLNGEYCRLISEHWAPNPEDWTRGSIYWLRITPAGKEFYKREWERYRVLYPDVVAPEPDQEGENENE